MELSVGRWGMGFRVGGMIAHLYRGDVYLRLPLFGELAWNSTGLHIERFA